MTGQAQGAVFADRSEAVGLELRLEPTYPAPAHEQADCSDGLYHFCVYRCFGVRG